MPRRRAGRLVTAVLTGGLLSTLLLTLLGAAPAQARPLPTDDRYRGYAGGTYTLSPLDNDDTSLLSTGELTLCGISGVDQQRVYAEQSGDTVLVELADGVSGTTRFTYTVCQGSQSAQGTVVLDVTSLADLRGVKKRKQPAKGKAVFTNPNRVPVTVSFGSATSGRPDGTRTVPAGRSITVSTTRRSLYWVGLHDDRGSLVVVGDGVIDHLQSTPRRRR